MTEFLFFNAETTKRKEKNNTLDKKRKNTAALKESFIFVHSNVLNAPAKYAYGTWK